MRDDILYIHVYLPIFVRAVRIRNPGKWHTMRLGVSCSSYVYVQVKFQLLPGV